MLHMKESVLSPMC